MEWYHIQFCNVNLPYLVIKNIIIGNIKELDTIKLHTIVRLGYFFGMLVGWHGFILNIKKLLKYISIFIHNIIYFIILYNTKLLKKGFPLKNLILFHSYFLSWFKDHCVTLTFFYFMSLKNIKVNCITEIKESMCVFVLLMYFWINEHEHHVIDLFVIRCVGGCVQLWLQLWESDVHIHNTFENQLVRTFEVVFTAWKAV